MPRLPNLNARKILRLLEKHGFAVDHVTGSHYVLYHARNNRRVTVPHHSGNLPKGTTASIFKQAGLSAEDVA